jgi:hypothetical protein
MLNLACSSFIRKKYSTRKLRARCDRMLQPVLTHYPDMSKGKILKGDRGEKASGPRVKPQVARMALFSFRSKWVTVTLHLTRFY